MNEQDQVVASDSEKGTGGHYCTKDEDRPCPIHKDQECKKPAPRPLTGPIPTPVSDELNADLSTILSSNWNREISVTMRASDLSWLVQLIEVGIETRRREWKALSQWGASEICSLSDFRSNLENLAAQIVAEARKPPKNVKRKK